MTFKRHIDRLPIIPADAKEHNVTCQFCIVGCGYKAYSWAINEQGGMSPSENKFGVDLSKQQLPMTPNWYAPSMYNIVKQDGKDVHLVIKPDPELRRELGPRLDSRRAHGRGILFRSPLNPTAAPDRTHGLALRANAADELGRRARSRCARDAGGHRLSGRGRALRFRFRSRRRRRRLRKHLGHGQALFRRDEDQEHPHSQSPGLQFRGACDPRHGRRRAQQLLRGRRTRRHDRRGRNERPGDADQLFPEPLGAEFARRLDRQEEGPASRRSASAGA